MSFPKSVWEQMEIAMTPWETVRVDSLLPRVLAFETKKHPLLWNMYPIFYSLSQTYFIEI